MKNSKKAHSKKSGKQEMSTAMIWTGTIFLCLIILGGSYYISRNVSPSEVYTEEAVKQPRPENEVTAVLPHPQTPEIEAKETGKATVSREGMTKTDEAADTESEGKPVLDLSNLAGTLKADIPSLMGQNRRIPLAHTCYRTNKTPPVAWRDSPPGTESYVVFLEKLQDSDEPFLYWSAYNIPSERNGLSAGLGSGPMTGSIIVYGQNDHGVNQYVGPCDPRGIQDYRIRVFALDRGLDLAPKLDKDSLLRAMSGHVIDMAEVPFIHVLRK